MKKENKKVIKDFTPSQVGTLIENFDKKLDILAENHLDVVKKLEDHDEHFEKFDQKLDRLSGDVEIIKEDIRIIKHDLKRKADIEIA
jgi:peptidoglycan hydrolase CwlO-like protein